ncbi:hypothetical protein FB451DRAFT_1400216 [Mycena latifolia]|nr:hypothetical protein FB451DRAFT_1400216 [Mycena latifolia]
MARGNRQKKNAMQAKRAAAASSSVSVYSHSVRLADLPVVPENASVLNVVNRFSADRRRMFREERDLEPPSPLKRQRLAATTAAQGSILPFLIGQDTPEAWRDERYVLNVDDNDDQPPPSAMPAAPKALCLVKPGDPALDKWQRTKRDTCVVDLTRLDGPGDADMEKCPGCSGASGRAPRFRCTDCFGGTLYCDKCIVSWHVENPLHRSWKWCGRSFVKTSLAELDLHVQLGHPPGMPCAGAEAAHAGFVVLHSNGIHEVRVDFCGCERQRTAGSPDVQLLRYGWFPATDDRPQTCATLDVLAQFQQETLQSKMTMYNFYGVLEKLTDNTGIKPPDRYHEWLRMCRKYRHALMLKRAGRATSYASGGAEATEQGELALECPACPRPGINLPEGWENATPEDRFLYTLFIALDACFRLKRLLVSSELRDPDLGSGWGYMVDTGPYCEYLRTVTDQKEMNTCSGLAALDYANTKFSRGYSTTGVAMGVCARHEFVQPNGVGDLQRGERFANMDYVFASILKHKHEKLFKFISYDIICIWSKHLFDRLKALPPNVWIAVVGVLFRFTIPKMHIHAHTLICQLLFSLNYLLGAAETDGEGTERAWGTLGAVAASTRNVGPGARHDVLESQLSYWNWLKLVGIVVSLRRRLDRANAELKEQTEALEVFSEQQAERVPVWKKMVLEFEQDETKKNPYDITIVGWRRKCGFSLLKFAEEEAAEAARGVPSLHDVSPSTFVASGLDLEAEQRRVRVHAELKKKGTTAMKISMKRLRGSLNRSIVRFRKLQKVYMPAAFQALAKKNLPATTLAEDVPLMLPSALSEIEREWCVPGLAHIEALLCDAQCRTGLVGLRNKLHIKSRLLTYKANQTRHQGPNTRARSVVTHNETKVRLNSEKYQAAWEAIRLLKDGNEASIGWRRLRRDDIRTMICMDWEDVEDEEAHGPENQRQVSWIWTMAGTSGTDADLEEALRVEWCKAFARVRRWTEEKRLVVEEYRQVGLSFEHEAAKWDTRAAKVRVGVLPLAEVKGAVAYAGRQAAMYRDLAARGEAWWTEVKLARGKKRARHLPSAVAAMHAERRREQAQEEEDTWVNCDSDDEGDEEASDGEGLEFGAAHSDDEDFIMGGDDFDK